MSADRSKQTRWVTIATALAVATITIVAFLPVLQAGFLNWDDDRNFTSNFHFRGLSADHLRWMWSTTLMGHYIPVTWMSLGLDYVVWGMDPRGYHLTNLLLHAGNAVLLWAILRQLLLGYSRWSARHNAASVIAAVAALSFSVHPLRVESVAWVTERRDILSLTFALLSVATYLRWVERKHRRWYALSIVAFAAGLLAKATIVTLPAALLVLNVYPLRRLAAGISRGRVLKELAPFAALSVIAGIGSVIAVRPPQQLSLFGKIVVSFHGFVFYLAKSLVPVGLSPLYEMPARLDWLSLRFAGSFVVVAIVAAVLWRFRRSAPALVASLVAFALLVLPLLGIVQNGPQIAADRYTYFAAIALTGIVAAAFSVAGLSWRSGAFSAVILAALAVGTWKQSAVWQSSERLWSSALDRDSTSAYALNNLATLRADSGQSSEALALYRKAITYRPDVVEPYVNAAKEFAKRGADDSASAYLASALRIDSTNADAWNAWGLQLAQQGKSREAIEAYRKSVALRPTLADAHNNLGVELARGGQIDEAVEQYRAALSVQPTHAEAHNNLGFELAERGALDSAMVHYSAALRFDPRLVDALVNFANALSMSQRAREALPYYAQAAELKPSDALIHFNWGQALEMLGDVAGAREHYQRAFALGLRDAEMRAAIKRTSDTAKPPGH